MIGDDEATTGLGAANIFSSIFARSSGM